VDGPGAAVGYAGVVEGGAVGEDSVLLAAVVDLVVEAGAVQESLGGDAADVEAGAAQLLGLDDGRPLPQLCRPDRRRVASGAAAENGHVEPIVGDHEIPL